MECADRRDSLLLFAAGVLEPEEAVELRQHLAAGCPTCAGVFAEANTALAMLPLNLPPHQPPAPLKEKIFRQISQQPQNAGMKIGAWDRFVLPAAIAAVLAVAVTLLVVRQFMPVNVHAPDDQQKIAALQGQLLIAETQLSDFQQSLHGMKFAELTGSLQPSAVGHVFLDPAMKNWYFFTCGMKPAPDGKTYELWLIHGNDKIPAGTFDVSPSGTATLLGNIPQLPAGGNVTLAITDEPMTGSHEIPTGHLQMKGVVE